MDREFLLKNFDKRYKRSSVSGLVFFCVSKKQKSDIIAMDRIKKDSINKALNTTSGDFFISVYGEDFDKNENKHKTGILTGNESELVKNEEKLEIDEQSLAGLENDENTKKHHKQKKVSKVKTQEQQQKRKKMWNTLFLCTNIIVLFATLVYQIVREEITPFEDLIGLNTFYVFVILLAFACIMTIDALRVNALIKKSGHRSRPYLSYKVCAVGKYYDAITPMSTGGQSFQVFYLNSRGHSTSASISVPMARYVFIQIAWVCLAIFAMSYVFSNNLITNDFLKTMSIFGFLLGTAILAVTLIISLNRRIGTAIVRGVLIVLTKIKIVKNFDEQFQKIMDIVEGYQSTIKKYIKNKLFFAGMTLSSFVIFILHFSMPFFIYLFLGGSDLSIYMQMLTLSIIIELAASFIPLPGGTGMNEVSFPLIFAAIYPSGTIVWAMLIWRLCNYYSYLIQGFFVIVYDYIVGNKKYKWLKRRWELEAESVVFKEMQIRKNSRKKNKNRRIY